MGADPGRAAVAIREKAKIPILTLARPLNPLAGRQGRVREAPISCSDAATSVGRANSFYCIVTRTRAR